MPSGDYVSAYSSLRCSSMSPPRVSQTESNLASGARSKPSKAPTSRLPLDGSRTLFKRACRNEQLSIYHKYLLESFDKRLYRKCLAVFCLSILSSAVSLPPENEARGEESGQNESPGADRGIFCHASVQGGGAVQHVQRGEGEGERGAYAQQDLV